MKKKAARVVPSKTTVQELVVRNGNEDRNILPLVLQIVKKSFFGELGSIEYQDVVGEGLLAVSKAMSKFDAGRGIKLTTFAYRGIQGAVKDLLSREQRYGERYEPTESHKFHNIEGPNHFEARMSNRLLFLQVVSVIETKLGEREALTLIRLYLEGAELEDVAKELRTTVKRVEGLRDAALLEVRQLIARRPEIAATLVATTDH